MAEGLKRSDLQAAADAKLLDAALLFQHARFSTAYYLAGYAVEIGLKASIASRIAEHVLPDKKFIDALYTHEIDKLVGLAGLRAELKKEQAENAEFAAYWGIVGEWTVDTRYTFVDSYSAQLMIQAVSDEKSGVLRWIKQHW